MNYAKIEKADCCNGTGVRTTLFVSGCTHSCPGCHNREAQNFKFGQEFTKDVQEDVLEECSKDYCAGLSISGGDPLHPKNIKEISDLVLAFRQRFGDTKTIWCWTGYTLDALEARVDPWTEHILANLDVLVDGPFIEALKDTTLQWRGSLNQRVLYPKK